MGLYDIMDEIAAKQVLKTETGDNRIFGVVVGVVAKNYDKDMPGRVCVRVPVRDENANELKWARVAMPASGSKWGHYFLPEVGDQVLLGFEQGNIEKPYVLGCLPKDSNSFLKKSAHEKNQYKKIITKNGSTIQFDDMAEGNGTRDKITVHTPDKAHRLEMDNDQKKIVLSDKDGKNKIEMKTEMGNIVIEAEKNVTLRAGQVEVILNGSSGGVTIKCDKFSVEASNSMSLTSNGAAAFSGGNVNLKAASKMKVSSSGMTSIEGAPVKIG